MPSNSASALPKQLLWDVSLATELYFSTGTSKGMHSGCEPLLHYTALSLVLCYFCVTCAVHIHICTMYLDDYYNVAPGRFC